MNDKIAEINTAMECIPNVKLIKRFETSKLNIEGCISIFVEGIEYPLEFDVSILPQYPFRSHDTETIKFSNDKLLEYKHVMGDGSICIHTAHTPILSEKLKYDIESVKAWIKKYYLNKDNDIHYEHLIIPQKTFKDSCFAYFFNEVDYHFSKGQYGYTDYSTISHGSFYTKHINSNIIQKFYDKNRKELIDVKWNLQLKSLTTSIGLFIFLKEAPSKNQRWVFSRWKDFEPFLSDDFLKFLYSIEKRVPKDIGKHLPLFIGYDISATEIHWQVIMLEIGKFPVYGEKVNKQWLSRLKEESVIDWAMTRNCSYKYFFGRGRLCNKITSSKILIIGIGAIGSVLAKTLVRCGCTRVDFIDYDVKEPENVCRSEYSFVSGINNKTNDLLNELFAVSPFFEPVNSGYDYSETFDFFMKSHFTDTETKFSLEQNLNEYDIIFDCSADNDLLYVLSQLNIKSSLLNFSISNHAKQFVCGAEYNRYDFITAQFNGDLLKFDVDDLHNPTGCWSPTFRASYNDISVLLQFAMKHINLRLEQGRTLRNFVIETNDSDCLAINLKEF